MRYLLQRLHDAPGKPYHNQPECGMTDTLIGEYQSDRNAIRYMGASLYNAKHFSAGKYVLTTFPKSNFTTNERHVQFLYKTVST